MIETIYLEIIILMILVWLFESKALPQIIVMFLAIAMLINEITIATDLKSQIGISIVFATVVLYSGLQIWSSKDIGE